MLHSNILVLHPDLFAPLNACMSLLICLCTSDLMGDRVERTLRLFGEAATPPGECRNMHKPRGGRSLVQKNEASFFLNTI